MSRIWCALTMALLLIIGPTLCRAQKDSATNKVLNQGIRATAFIYDMDSVTHFTVRDGRPALAEDMIQRTGSAFCISDLGYYITNEHVVSHRREGAFVRMNLCVGTGYSWDVDALIVRKDRAHDLALLKIVKHEGIYPLALAVNGAPERGTPVTAFGFPGGFRKSHHAISADPNVPLPPMPFSSSPDIALPPKVTVTSGKITNLYGTASVLKGIEADTKVAPGSSGGPLLNRKGELIGVVEAINRKTGRCLAISVPTLKAFLARPDVAQELDPPSVRLDPVSVSIAQCAQERAFVLRMSHHSGAPFVSGVPVTVRLHLSAPGIASRLLEAKPLGNGRYGVQAAPVPPTAETHEVTLVARRNGNVAFYYHVRDQAVQVGAQTVALSRIARITNADSPSVVFVDGTQQALGVTGLDRLDLPQREDTPDVDLNAAESISVIALPVTPPALDYHAEVRTNGHVMAEQWGQIVIQGAPPRPKRAGMIIVCADEWPTNSTGPNGHTSELTPSSRQYIRNIANLFTAGLPGHLLIYSTHWTYSRPFIETLLEDRHTVTVATQPVNWNGYDAIFLGGHDFPTDALIHYVQQGGCVYIAGGCGSNDGILANGLLRAFGLEMEADGRIENWRVAPNVTLPLFAGVSELKMESVSAIKKLPGNWPNTYVTMPQFGIHLWGIYSRNSDAIAPLFLSP